MDKWSVLLIVGIVFCTTAGMALTDIFGSKNKTEECTSIRSEELITPDLVITVSMDSTANDTDYVYRIK